ncbi:XrtY-associated glycosyltransferase XYAG1 [Mucilaginibacter sp. AW1-3]
MKILFIVPYYKPAYAYGGPIVVISMLAERLVLLGHDVTVYTTASNVKSELKVAKNQEVIVDGVKVYYFSKLTGDNTYISFTLWRYLNQTATDYDVIHIHTWWNFLVLGAALICRNKGIKPIISPHGMLSDYILYNRNVLAKKWVHKLIGKNLLKNSWLHVSTGMEWDESKRIIEEWDGEIIPNLVKLPGKKYPRENNPVFTIGFLSRIDPKKGLDILIKALSKVDFDYKLLIAGSGEAHYIDTLKAITHKNGNSKKVEWVGWKGGDGKFEYLSQIDLMALTSHSENFAIVVIESLAVGTPVFISDQVGLFKFVNEKDYGWVTHNKVEEVTSKLNELYKEKGKFTRINNECPAQIAHQYEESHLVEQYLQLYNLSLKK